MASGVFLQAFSSLQAEAKAEEAVRKMEALLTSWLPHWLEQRYHQVCLTLSKP